MTDLEKKFNIDMRDIYINADKECGYKATRFFQLVSEIGGLAAAKQLINKEGATEGFTTLWMYHRLDLSVEAHVIKPEYAELFTEDEKEKCLSRLKAYGYNF